LIGKQKKLFFGGDTGYCKAFKEIGKKYGGFDVSLIPIGAYEPRFMMESSHVDPEQAVQIHLDVVSKKSIAVHWGTFALANEVISGLNNVFHFYQSDFFKSIFSQ